MRNRTLRNRTLRNRTRRWWILGGVVAVLAIAALTWVLWPSPEPPRARPYLAYTACLLTDDQGLAGRPAMHAWAGMQDASLATHAKVQYLPVIGAQTRANALPYLASLLQRQCSIVIAAGDAPNQALAAEAGSHPGVLFVGVGAAPATGHLTVVAATSPDQIRHDIDTLVTNAVHAAG